MSQESLDFGRLYRVDEFHRLSMRKLDDAVTSIGQLVAAGATKIDRSDLMKMFEAGTNRRLPFKAAFSIGALAGYELRRAIAEPFVECLGFVLADDRPPMTDKERADRTEAALLALGPIGVQALQAALGGRR